MTDNEVQREIKAVEAMYMAGLMLFDEMANRLIDLGIKIANDSIQDQIIDEVSEERDDP